MKTKIKVTQKHIDEGVRRNCKQCPVALALREHLQERIEVSYERIGIGDGRALTTRGIRQFIRDYDADKVTLPCTLILDDENVTLSMEGETL